MKIIPTVKQVCERTLKLWNLKYQTFTIGIIFNLIIVIISIWANKTKHCLLPGACYHICILTTLNTEKVRHNWQFYTLYTFGTFYIRHTIPISKSL